MRLDSRAPTRVNVCAGAPEEGVRRGGDRMRAMIIRLFLSVGIPALAAVTGTAAGADIAVPGLSAPVRVLTAAAGARPSEAANDLDGARAQGFVHCRDRLFQMDQTRRQVDGTEAELLGPGRLAADVQARTLGLHRAAQRSLDAAPPALKTLLEAYADGVNHCIATVPLPPEDALLALTQVRPWEAVDSVKIGKAISAPLSLDVDTGLTEDLLAFVSAGSAGGAFDGQVLFSADVFRAAPMDPA